MNTDEISRRMFSHRTSSGLVLVSSPLGAFAQTPAQQPVPKRPDRLAPVVVEEFVRKAHKDLAGTTAMLAEQPTLLNAAGGEQSKAVVEYLSSLGAA